MAKQPPNTDNMTHQCHAFERLAYRHSRPVASSLHELSGLPGSFFLAARWWTLDSSAVMHFVIIMIGLASGESS